MEQLLARLEMLEYHQKIMINMIKSDGHEFDLLIIKNNLIEKEVNYFLGMCEELNNEMDHLKADHYVFFAPLYLEFINHLHEKLEPAEVINACIKQNIFPELMKIFLKNLND